DQDNNEHIMAYWLSNTSTLLFLVQKSLRSDRAYTVRKPPSPTSLFGRTAMGFRPSPSTTVNLAAATTTLEVLPQVVAKYPALLFKQRLTAFMQNIHGIIRDNLKKELSSFLTLRIQTPQASKRVPRSFGKDSQPNHWQGILDCLNTHLSTLKENFVPLIIVQNVLTQIFSYINSSSAPWEFFRNGEYIKAGLAELELWCCMAKEEVVNEKPKKSFSEIIHDICP
ncbi:LOW QUALITY PROTEIN: hypothetical protein M8C21_024477, partial [Ambrosia artemisiifolia]